MERSKSALTPQNYTRAVISLSRRYASTSAFPGNNYVDIGEWMLQDRNILESTKPDDENVLFASKSEQPHDLVVLYNSGERKWELQEYRQEQHEAFSASDSVPAGGLGQIVFIRGFISPSWVSAIGSKYRIDPEFFRRHMSFLSASIDRHAYGSPSLASSSNNIFRLCVSTILHRDDFGGQNLPSQRAEQAIELGKYKIQQLGSANVCCGDSLVREYSTVCASFSVIEQWISLCLMKTNKGWTVVVWMDQGRPLEHSPPGPWTSHIESNATVLPVLQHHHKMAFRTTTNQLEPDANASAKVQQSTAILPLQYESLIALVDLARRAPHDPLSMCIPLYAHAAFSEVQFLNLMESRIQIHTDAIVEGISADALGTFQYLGNILNRHTQQLKDTIRGLRRLLERANPGLNAMNVETPPASGSPPPGLGMGRGRQSFIESETIRSNLYSSSDGAFTAKGLLEDYEELYVRCMDLSNKCTQGITLAMNKATIEESRKGIEQSDRLKKLTLLATLFIPLSFCSSLFGMNVDIFGQGNVNFWWFFVICIPVTTVTYILYIWDVRVLKRCYVALLGVFHGMTRDRGVRRVDKDPNHVV